MPTDNSKVTKADPAGSKGDYKKNLVAAISQQNSMRQKVQEATEQQRVDEEDFAQFPERRSQIGRDLQKTYAARENALKRSKVASTHLYNVEDSMLEALDDREKKQ